MINLKPCPFCGGTAEIATVTRHIEDNLIVVRCTRCKAGTKTFSEHRSRNAIEAWDIRPDKANVVEIDQFNQWISVEDKLPEDMGDVLVWAFWHEKWGVRLGWHSQHNDGWHICTAGGDFGHIEVTHWMPLPNTAPLQSVITGLHEAKSDCADRK